MARRPATKTVDSRLTAVERGIRSLHATDIAIIKEMRDGFFQTESRFDQIHNHIDGFMKLHETLDIEFRVIKDSAKDSRPLLFPPSLARSLGSFPSCLR